MSAESYADLFEDLFAAYESKHSTTVSEAVAAECNIDLAGQTPPGASLELLARLTRQRLEALPPSRPSP